MPTNRIFLIYNIFWSLFQFFFLELPDFVCNFAGNKKIYIEKL